MAKECVMLPKHHRFVGRETDAVGFNALLTSVLKSFQGRC